MPIPVGTSLGPYEVLAPLGAGGMGEVYRARDTRLGRDVKVLPSDLANDAERRARFEREARAVAALDHPQICSIYDVGERGGTHYLVMPLLEGQTLAARLEKGPLPVDQALTLATRIADALDKAHRQGIVHRDRKPANVMLTKTGAKLLDFGLAKLRAPGGPVQIADASRTATATGTAAGTILGTVHYMAPEQVEGKEADARSDIWALGAVIFEMATGARPFTGDSAASVIGAIMKDTPSRVSARQPLAPAPLDRLVATCLEKDPDDRWQTARDLVRELRWIAAGGGPAAPSRATSRERVSWAVGMLGLVVAAAATWSRGSDGDATAPPLRFTIPPPDRGAFMSGAATVPATQLAISPDGRRLVFAASAGSEPARLWVRELDSTTPVPLSGTVGAEYPFWAPDSRSVGFFADGKLKTTAVADQVPRTLCDAPEGRGGTWNSRGEIVFGFSNSLPLFRISEQGGSPVPATTLDVAHQETSHRYPSFLPGGRQFVYFVRSVDSAREGVYVGSLESSDTRRLLPSRWTAVFAAPGYLLFADGGRLLGQSLDLRALQLEGAPFLVAPNVGASTTDFLSVSASDTGVLAYGGPTMPPSRLTWFDRTGSARSTLTGPGDFVNVVLSPDGKRVAYSLVNPEQNTPDVWLLDLAAGAAPSRFTFDPGLDTHPVWAPDGSRIVFRSYRNGVGQLYEKPSAGGPESLIPTIGFDKAATDWSRDGKSILFQHQSERAATLFDVWTLNVADRKPTAFLAGPATEVQGKLSPDGPLRRLRLK